MCQVLIAKLVNKKFADRQDIGKGNTTSRAEMPPKTKMEGSIYLMNMCSELEKVMLGYPSVQKDAEKLLHNFESEDCLPLNGDIETFKDIQRRDDSGVSSSGINCNNYSNKWKDGLGATKNKSLQEQMLLYPLVLLVSECATINASSKRNKFKPFQDIDDINRSSKHLP